LGLFLFPGHRTGIQKNVDIQNYHLTCFLYGRETCSHIKGKDKELFEKSAEQNTVFGF
jgi:hypothetical protein